VTIELNKLAASALVDKDIDEEDRRRVVLAVTPKARLAQRTDNGATPGQR
jgi:DNA-binding MarR family transcriptional regulator